MNPAYVLLGLVVLGLALFSWSATAEEAGPRDDGPGAKELGPAGRLRRWGAGAAWLVLGLGLAFLVEIAPALILDELFPADEPTGIECPSASRTAADPAAQADIDALLLSLGCPPPP